MSVEAIDQMLAAWDDRLERIDATLLALEGEPTYQMLAPRSATRSPLEGLTAQVVGPALDALAELFEHRGHLTEILDRAKAVRESMPTLAFWGGDAKEQEIRALLEGPSIQLPPEATPLARRALLDPGGRDVRVAPEQLLGAMMAAFGRARDAVIAVKEAWARVDPELERLDREVSATRASSRALGVEASAAGELEAIEREIAAVRAAVARDPLGAAGSLDARLATRVAAVASGLGAVAAQRLRVEEGLARSRESMVALGAAHAAAREALEELPREIEHATAGGPALEESAVADLGTWLDRIEQAALAGRWGTAEVGLGPWTDALQAATVHEAQICGARSALLGRRDELVGRLGARRAQAAALAARGIALDPDAEAFAVEAEALLAERPTPLARARTVVERFEAAVRAARKG